jgi:all-trans-8'-apo-beta-carotenal 15,15'-oxygenase
VAPAVHGRRYRHAWFAALPSAQDDEPYAYVLTRRIGHLDVESGELSHWDAGEGHQLSPPAFAPDPDADDPEKGWLLAWDLDLQKETTDVVVLDAQNLPAGPVARVRLGVYLPAVSHARFAPGARVRA